MKIIEQKVTIQFSAKEVAAIISALENNKVVTYLKETQDELLKNMSFDFR